ncbi:dCTP deaminase [Prosthecomicrobium hirschii]|uniref:dCTP deaminase n=1 Tax=Prosthecodimorpha hirschii TaxID=665126 RepID=UPI00221FE66C|nr:dCTP deaminase [Prosthecomicrobium hirschii]MCW1844167.1 dCTP deaminase [Prosthecomicrobium hirschii]
MILSAQSIRHLCVGPRLKMAMEFNSGLRPMIEPFHERSIINGMSFGLSSCGYDVRIAQTVELRTGDFVLASTMERFALPDDVVGLVAAKSSLARRGISVHEMTVFEPGWCGYATVEISMHGHEPFVIHEGDPIAQIIFARLDAPTCQPYPADGKYQHQPNRPVPALNEWERA